MSRPAPAPHPRKAAKTARFLDLETEREGSPTSVPLARVAGIAAEVAPTYLSTGAARTALRKAVLGRPERRPPMILTYVIVPAIFMARSSHVPADMCTALS